ncbi:MAG: hypothetical protein HYZ53_07885 [Planctomycetes bacterium]|nr:hypothetical protein [Planctomycetota bacterium]
MSPKRRSTRRTPGAEHARQQQLGEDAADGRGDLQESPDIRPQTVDALQERMRRREFRVEPEQHVASGASKPALAPVGGILEEPSGRQ